MKKLFLILTTIFTIVCTTPAFANFNYGYDTYNQDGGTLILNSTGDQVTNSTFGNLGSNDFIAELAVKNMLAMDGYTVAYDYNPQNTDGQFANNYNVQLPTGVALTKLTFAGFLGNPRATQDVYVLTSEYNALSSQGQANSISSLQSQAQALGSSLTSVSAQTNTNTSNISTLQNVVGNQANLISGNTASINNLNTGLASTNNHVSALTNVVNYQGGEISGLQTNVGQLNTQVAGNTADIGNLYGITSQHTAQIGALNTGLAQTNQNVSTVATQVNTNTANIGSLGQGLAQTNQNVNAVVGTTVYEQGEIVQNNNNIASLANVQQGQQNQINGLNNRVGALERTQAIIGLDLRLYDSRKWQINAFLDYTMTRHTVQAIGVRFTYKMGKSYEETQIDELNAKLNKLLDIKDQKERTSNIETYYTGDGIGMRTKF